MHIAEGKVCKAIASTIKIIVLTKKEIYVLAHFKIDLGEVNVCSALIKTLHNTIPTNNSFLTSPHIHKYPRIALTYIYLEV